MTMLSGMQRARAPARRRSGAAPLAVAAGRFGLAFRVAGEAVEALPEGALWIDREETLVVSDMHLEKGSAFARRGQLLPPYDTRAALTRLEALVTRLAPARIVSLGDSFHDVGGPDRMDAADRDRLAGLVATAEWVWVEGNHDPALPAALGGRTCAALRIGALTLRHEPTEGADEGEIAGHLHPCAKAVGRAGAMRTRCFAASRDRLVMPAFGAYAGGLNVRDAAFDPLFPGGLTALMMGKAKLYAARCVRLTPD